MHQKRLFFRLYFKEIHAQCYFSDLALTEKNILLTRFLFFFLFLVKYISKAESTIKEKIPIILTKSEEASQYTVQMFHDHSFSSSPCLGSPTISSRMNRSVPLKLEVLLIQHHLVQGKIKKTWKLIWCNQCVLYTMHRTVIMYYSAEHFTCWI